MDPYRDPTEGLLRKVAELETERAQLQAQLKKIKALNLEGMLLFTMVGGLIGFLCGVCVLFLVK